MKSLMLVTFYLGFILSGFYSFYLESNQTDDPEWKYTPESLRDPNIVFHSVKQGTFESTRLIAPSVIAQKFNSHEKNRMPN